MRGARTLVFWRLVVTTCKQAAEAPIVDECWGQGESRKDIKRWPRMPTWLAPECRFTFHGFAVLLTPWRRNEYGRLPGRALVVGWMGEREPLA